MVPEIHTVIAEAGFSWCCYQRSYISGEPSGSLRIHILSCNINTDNTDNNDNNNNNNIWAQTSFYIGGLSSSL